MDERAKKYQRRLAALEQERNEWESLWQELSDYLCPYRGFYIARGQQPNRGDRRGGKIRDGVATRALRILAAGLQGGLTSPARPWFRLGLSDSGLSEQSGVREWLAAVERIMYAAFARSNFYSAIHSVYADLAAFGTACLYEEEDPARILHFRVLTAGEYALACDSRGRTDTVYRRIWMTAEQMIDRFGEERVSDSVREAMTNDRPDQWFEVLHAVQPRRKRDATKKDGINLPYESLYQELAGEGAVLSEGGYEEFPYMAPRWDITGSDVYGRSPGMDTLPDVKMLQKMQEKSIKAIEKQVDPPLRVPISYADSLNTVPGGINYIDSSNPAGLGPLYEVRFDVAAAEAKIERVQQAVREGLFNDLFLMILERPNMTATEVSERHEEKLLMLGPVIERQFSELLDPLIDRTFGILWRAGRIPPSPQELQGREMKVEYISLLAQAQKLVGTQSIGAAMQFVGMIAQMNPEVLDKVDFDEAVSQYGDLVGLPPKIIRPDAAVAQIRQARAQQQQQVQAEQQAMAMAQGAQVLGKTPTNPDEPNALTDLMAALGASQNGGAQ